jgi:hypothetical protein
MVLTSQVVVGNLGRTLSSGASLTATEDYLPAAVSGAAGGCGRTTKEQSRHVLRRVA